MCIGICIAVEEQLSYQEAGLASRHISVSKAWGDDSPCRAFFSKRYIYTVYTTPTGDGCGFQYDNRAGQEARDALADLLDRSLTRTTEVELFVDYFDPQTPGIKPDSYDRISPCDIRTWRSRFQPGEFLIIVGDA